MCLDMIGQVQGLETSAGADGGVGAAVIDVDGHRKRVSLAILELEGVAVSVGDWLQAHTGLALRILEPGQAERVLAERRTMYRAAELGAVAESGEYRTGGSGGLAANTGAEETVHETHHP